MGIGIAARAGFDPYGASRFLTDMERNADLSSPTSASGSHPLDFLSSHPSTPDRVRNAVVQARHYSAPGSGERDQGGLPARAQRPRLWRGSEGRLYPRAPLPASEARLHLHRAARDSRSTTARRRCSVSSRRRRQALRLDVVQVPAEQSLADYLGSGWLENIDRQSIQDAHHQRLSGRDRHGAWQRSGRSGFMPSASAARSIASSSPPSR